MAVLKRGIEESVVVLSSDGSESTVTITVKEVDGENVTLKVDVQPGVIVQSGEEWKRVQSAKQAGKGNQGAERPKSRAAYGN